MGSELHESMRSESDRGCPAHGSETDQAAHVYNALNWHIIKRADTDLDGILDHQRIMYYARKSKLSRPSPVGPAWGQSTATRLTIWR